MHEQAESVGLTGPEAANLTIFALLTPGLGVKMSLRVEGRDDFIAMGRAALRVFRGACEMKSYALKQEVLLFDCERQTSRAHIEIVAGKSL
jgi:hypothetical protein